MLYRSILDSDEQVIENVSKTEVDNNLDLNDVLITHILESSQMKVIKEQYQEDQKCNLISRIYASSLGATDGIRVGLRIDIVHNKTQIFSINSIDVKTIDYEVFRCGLVKEGKDGWKQIATGMMPITTVKNLKSRMFIYKNFVKNLVNQITGVNFAFEPFEPTKVFQDVVI